MDETHDVDTVLDLGKRGRCHFPYHRRSVEVRVEKLKVVKITRYMKMSGLCPSRARQLISKAEETEAVEFTHGTCPDDDTDLIIFGGRFDDQRCPSLFIDRWMIHLEGLSGFFRKQAFRRFLKYVFIYFEYPTKINFHE